MVGRAPPYLHICLASSAWGGHAWLRVQSSVADPSPSSFNLSSAVVSVVFPLTALLPSGFFLRLSSSFPVPLVVVAWLCAGRCLMSSCRPRSVLAVLSSCKAPRSLCYESTDGVDSMAFLSKLAWPFVVALLVPWVICVVVLCARLLTSLPCFMVSIRIRNFVIVSIYAFFFSSSCRCGVVSG
jgi:hypothetical protein